MIRPNIVFMIVSLVPISVVMSIIFVKVRIIPTVIPFVVMFLVTVVVTFVIPVSVAVPSVVMAIVPVISVAAFVSIPVIVSPANSGKNEKGENETCQSGYNYFIFHFDVLLYKISRRVEAW